MARNAMYTERSNVNAATPTVPRLPVNQERVYAVPRRLDLTMLLSITLAYALLFTVMRILQASATTFALTAGLFTAVGIGQAVLFGGNSPRAASVLVGAFGVLGLLGGGVPPALFFLIVGGFCGYVAGLLDAGVFLLLDMARQSLKRTSTAADVSEDRSAP